MSGLTHFLFLEGKVIFLDTGNQFLGTEHIGKLMGQYAVPCIISLLVGALYNIVDQILSPTPATWDFTATPPTRWCSR